MMTDPIADMLTRVRNGINARHAKVDIPASNLKTELARILKEEGYIQNFKRIDDDKQGVLRVFLRRGSDSADVVLGICESMFTAKTRNWNQSKYNIRLEYED